MSHFKIKATPKNVAHTQSFAPEYDNRYSVGNATAEICGKWIYFTLSTHTAAMFASGQISKRSFLREAGY